MTTWDLGEVVRRLQSRYLGSPANRKPTVAELVQLTDELEELTEALVSWPGFADGVAAGVGVDGSQWGDREWKKEFHDWEARLEGYQAVLKKARTPDDALWTVTAPLLMGLYGGRESQEQRRVIDAATPFILANALEVSDQARAEKWAAFWDDLSREAKDVGKGITIGLGGLGLLAASALGLYLLARE